MRLLNDSHQCTIDAPVIMGGTTPVFEPQSWEVYAAIVAASAKPAMERANEYDQLLEQRDRAVFEARAAFEVA